MSACVHFVRYSCNAVRFYKPLAKTGSVKVFLARVLQQDPDRDRCRETESARPRLPKVFDLGRGLLITSGRHSITSRVRGRRERGTLVLLFPFPFPNFFAARYAAVTLRRWRERRRTYRKNRCGRSFDLDAVDYAHVAATRRSSVQRLCMPCYAVSYVNPASGSDANEFESDASDVFFLFFLNAALVAKWVWHRSARRYTLE
jgi:hypothetical protein